MARRPKHHLETTMQITAINPKYQRALEKLYKADRKHCAYVDRNQIIMEELEYGTDRYFRTEERLADKECDQYEDLRDRFVFEPELPKGELELFRRTYKAFHGYEPYLV